MLLKPNGRDRDDLNRKFSGMEETSSGQNLTRFMHPYKERRVRRLADKKSDPLHVFQGVNLTKSFSNAVGYVRSRPNVSEVKRLYAMRLRTRANVIELERTACLSMSPEVTIGSSLRDVPDRARPVVTLETR